MDPHVERLSGTRHRLAVFTSADGGSFKQASHKSITLTVAIVAQCKHTSKLIRLSMLGMYSSLYPSKPVEKQTENPFYKQKNGVRALEKGLV